jgi:hypothetical protein
LVDADAIMLFEVNIMLDWKRKQSEESKKYVCFKKTMYQTVIGERQDKKEGRRGEKRWAWMDRMVCF